MATGKIEGEESKQYKVYTRKNLKKPKNPDVIPRQSSPPKNSDVVLQQSSPPKSPGVVPQQSSPPKSPDLVPQPSSPSPPTNPDLVPQQSSPPKSSDVIPQQSSPPKSPEVVPQQSSPPKSPDVVPQRSSPPKSPDVVPQQSSPPKSPDAVPQQSSPPTNPDAVPQQSSPPAQAATATSADNNNNSSHHQQQQQQPQCLEVAQSHDSSSLNRVQQGAECATDVVATSGYVKSDKLVKISLNLLSKNEVRVLERKLASELELVRGLVKKVEAKESRVNGGYANSWVSGNENVNRGGGNLVRVHSDVGSVGLPSSRTFHELTVSVPEYDLGNHGGGGSESVEKEKRTRKANQYYKNSGFLLGNETKPMDSKKKMKPSVGKSNGGQMGGGVATEKFTSQLFRSCSHLLGKLMKHKFGWVFHKPVDVKGLGLHDYYTIVKHPMDLGTVKTKLSKNLYKSPREFAEDVRLTFRNAMLYNPKGQDVHFMADTLAAIFEEKWRAIASEYYNLNTWLERSHDYGLPTPTSRRVPAPLPASAPVQARAPLAPARAPSSLPLEARTLERSESMAMPVDPNSRPVNLTPTGRIGVPKKPKAKDPHKRDMTFDEKHRLSLNLQSLPSEKLDSIVQIIKKRNPTLFQQEDEVEVDIDSVDPETLWELDRFVTNYKKRLSKNKKKVEYALQANAEDDHNINETNLEPPAAEVPKVAETVERIVPRSSPIHGERQRDNDIGSSSSSTSSSSSSESGSSSSDSDSDSSSR